MTGSMNDKCSPERFSFSLQLDNNFQHNVVVIQLKTVVIKLTTMVQQRLTTVVIINYKYVIFLVCWGFIQGKLSDKPIKLQITFAFAHFSMWLSLNVR